MEARRPMVYISGALSDMSEEERAVLRQFYEDLAAVCEKVGFVAYLPHKVSDPKTAPHMTPQDVDEIDRTAVTTSRLMVMYAGRPSFGPGIELEMANHANRRVILVFEEDMLKSRRISRLVRGNPAVLHEVTFHRGNTASACAKLEAILLDLIATTRASNILPPALKP